MVVSLLKNAYYLYIVFFSISSDVTLISSFFCGSKNIYDNEPLNYN